MRGRLNRRRELSGPRATTSRLHLGQSGDRDRFVDQARVERARHLKVYIKSAATPGREGRSSSTTCRFEACAPKAIEALGDRPLAGTKLRPSGRSVWRAPGAPQN